MNRHLRFCIVLLVLLGWLVPLTAGAQVLKRVMVKGNRRVEPDAVLVVTKLRAGDRLDPKKVAEDIRAIYALGTFDDVRAELEGDEQNPVLVYRVKEKPSIAEIAYTGYDEVDLDKIKEVVDIKPLSVLDVARIKKNVQKIKDLYVEKGFFLAEVDYRIDKLPKNSVKLTFVINERAKVEVTRIEFVGNENITDQELEDIMETREKGFFSFLTSSGTFKWDGLKRDMMRVNQYYYDHGYINVKVGEPIVQIARDRRTMSILIDIEEGEQYRFGNLTFSGDLLVPDDKLLDEIEKAIDAGSSTVVVSEALLGKLRKKLNDQKIDALKMEILHELKADVRKRIEQGVWEEDQPAKPDDSLRGKLKKAMLDELKKRVLESYLLVKPGELFNRTKLGMSLFRIQDVYKDRGYAYVEVVPVTNVDAKARIADINFSIQKGSKVFIERIEIEGNVKTRDKVIRRQLRIYEGEYYSGTGLETSRRRVNMLGFFESVDISESQGSRPDRIVITVKVKERPTGTFQIGAGFSSVENFIATAQISNQNFFGHGQTVALMAQLSSLRQLFSLNFVDPYFLDTNWYFSFQVYNTLLDYYTFVRKASGGSVTWGYEFIDDWRVALSYTLEHVDVEERGGVRHYNLFRDGWTSSVRLTLTWDTRDNRLFPTDGHLLQGSVEHAGPYTGSENDFTRLTWVSRFYLPVVWQLVFKTNVIIGYITPGAPIFEKYFAGGIYTVRGYEPRSIGPTELLAADAYDPGSYLTPTNVGGNKEFIANFELEFPIFPQVQIRGVVFLDAGNAFGEGEYLFQDRFSNHPATGQRIKETWLGLYWSTGFGFRWFSPIGPLRFEWGIPLTRRPGDKDILFEFTIGNFF
ncbi:MAG: outer membrane protein assembly factor BamA [Deltaproteobacteria bacterium]|nr:MAG: outer membrane protein assembly factor BamA [Deltaproteobacteria bacterium]